jgi:hypothetical protein
MLMPIYEGPAHGRNACHITGRQGAAGKNMNTVSMQMADGPTFPLQNLYINVWAQPSRTVTSKAVKTSIGLYLISGFGL